jgi:hypothetical protein
MMPLPFWMCVWSTPFWRRLCWFALSFAIALRGFRMFCLEWSVLLANCSCYLCCLGSRSILSSIWTCGPLQPVDSTESTEEELVVVDDDAVAEMVLSKFVVCGWGRLHLWFFLPLVLGHIHCRSMLCRFPLCARTLMGSCLHWCRSSPIFMSCVRCSLY